MTARQQQIAALGPWFHNIHLPDGEQTAPGHFLGDFPRYKWAILAPHLPQDLSGWTALDIGCNAGFYSIELARRGAHVTGIDLDAHYLQQAEWSIREFGLESSISLRQMQIYDLARLEEQFDLVLFMGVFYHLRYPLLGLDLVREKVRQILVFQTLTLPGDAVFTPEADYTFEQREVMLREGWPSMAFVEHQFANDPTNWWVANRAAVEAMLRSSGFSIAANPEKEMYLCVPDNAVRGAYMAGVIQEECFAATGRTVRQEK